MKSYVEQREEQLKLEYQVNMWWIHMSGMWDELGKAMAIKREADYYQSELLKIRAKYIRKGRPVGWRKSEADKEQAA